MDFYSHRLGEWACAALSALTVTIVAHPELVEASEDLPIQVELRGGLTRGMTVAGRVRETGAASANG